MIFRKLLIFIPIILICNNRLYAEKFTIEEVRYDKDISFPYIISNVPEKKAVADRINKRLQDMLFGEGVIINKSNIQSIEEYIYFKNDSIDQAGISSLNYTYYFYPNYLRVIINIDWAGGPYPLTPATDNLHFDLEKGEMVKMPDLIAGSKYFEFLEKFWLNECNNSIREAHQCAYGNETGDYESKKAYTLDGQCEFQCHKMNHQFILNNESIFISNNSNCFPHAWQNCNTGSSRNLKINEIIPYLSNYGKWLLGLSNKFCDVEPYFHFVGKIDEKYKISMSLCKRKDNKIIGEYFYWKQNKKIKLEGQINTGSQKIFLNEWVENSKTGSFDLEWDDFLYSTEGFWYAPSNEKKLSVKLINVYDFEDREYYR